MAAHQPPLLQSCSSIAAVLEQMGLLFDGDVSGSVPAAAPEFVGDQPVALAGGAAAAPRKGGRLPQAAPSSELGADAPWAPPRHAAAAASPSPEAAAARPRRHVPHPPLHAPEAPVAPRRRPSAPGALAPAVRAPAVRAPAVHAALPVERDPFGLQVLGIGAVLHERPSSGGRSSGVCSAGGRRSSHSGSGRCEGQPGASAPGELSRGAAPPPRAAAPRASEPPADASALDRPPEWMGLGRIRTRPVSAQNPPAAGLAPPKRAPPNPPPSERHAVAHPDSSPQSSSSSRLSPSAVAGMLPGGPPQFEVAKPKGYVPVTPSDIATSWHGTPASRLVDHPFRRVDGTTASSTSSTAAEAPRDAPQRRESQSPSSGDVSVELLSPTGAELRRDVAHPTSPPSGSNGEPAAVTLWDNPGFSPRRAAAGAPIRAPKWYTNRSAASTPRALVRIRRLVVDLKASLTFAGGGDDDEDDAGGLEEPASSLGAFVPGWPQADAALGSAPPASAQLEPSRSDLSTFMAEFSQDAAAVGALVEAPPRETPVSDGGEGGAAPASFWRRGIASLRRARVRRGVSAAALRAQDRDRLASQIEQVCAQLHDHGHGRRRSVSVAAAAREGRAGGERGVDPGGVAPQDSNPRGRSREARGAAVAATPQMRPPAPRSSSASVRPASAVLQPSSRPSAASPPLLDSYAAWAAARRPASAHAAGAGGQRRRSMDAAVSAAPPAPNFADARSVPRARRSVSRDPAAAARQATPERARRGNHHPSSTPFDDARGGRARRRDGSAARGTPASSRPRRAAGPVGEGRLSMGDGASFSGEDRPPAAAALLGGDRTVIVRQALSSGSTGTRSGALATTGGGRDWSAPPATQYGSRHAKLASDTSLDCTRALRTVSPLITQDCESGPATPVLSSVVSVSEASQGGIRTADDVCACSQPLSATSSFLGTCERPLLQPGTAGVRGGEQPAVGDGASSASLDDVTLGPVGYAEERVSKAAHSRALTAAPGSERPHVETAPSPQLQEQARRAPVAVKSFLSQLLACFHRSPDGRPPGTAPVASPPGAAPPGAVVEGRSQRSSASGVRLPSGSGVGSDRPWAGSISAHGSHGAAPLRGATECGSRPPPGERAASCSASRAASQEGGLVRAAPRPQSRSGAPRPPRPLGFCFGHASSRSSEHGPASPPSECVFDHEICTAASMLAEAFQPPDGDGRGDDGASLDSRAASDDDAVHGVLQGCVSLGSATKSLVVTNSDGFAWTARQIGLEEPPEGQAEGAPPALSSAQTPCAAVAAPERVSAAAADMRRASAAHSLGALRKHRSKERDDGAQQLTSDGTVPAATPRGPNAAPVRSGGIRTLAARLLRRLTNGSSGAGGLPPPTPDDEARGPWGVEPKGVDASSGFEDEFEPIPLLVPKAADDSIDFMSLPDLMVQRLEMAARMAADGPPWLEVRRPAAVGVDAVAAAASKRRQGRGRVDLASARLRRRCALQGANALKRTQLMAAYEQLQAELCEWRFAASLRRAPAGGSECGALPAGKALMEAAAEGASAGTNEANVPESSEHVAAAAQQIFDSKLSAIARMQERLSHSRPDCCRKSNTSPSPLSTCTAGSSADCDDASRQPTSGRIKHVPSEDIIRMTSQSDAPPLQSHELPVGADALQTSDAAGPPATPEVTTPADRRLTRSSDDAASCTSGGDDGSPSAPAQGRRRRRDGGALRKSRVERISEVREQLAQLRERLVNDDRSEEGAEASSRWRQAPATAARASGAGGRGLSGRSGAGELVRSSDGARAPAYGSLRQARLAAV